MRLLKPGLYWWGILSVAVSCDQRPAAEEFKAKPPRLDGNMPKPRLLSEIQPAKFKAADLRVKPRPVWVKSGSRKGRLSQSEKPAINAEKTAKLAGSIVAEELAQGGAVELQSGGLLIHPSETMPTRVEFEVGGKFDHVMLHVWIGTLPEQGLTQNHFGTVGISVRVDGRPQGRVAVDRYINQSIELCMIGLE